MSIIDKIQSLDQTVDKEYYHTPLVEALELYHSLIDSNVIQPRENQLNKSRCVPKIVHFNSKQ